MSPLVPRVAVALTSACLVGSFAASAEATTPPRSAASADSARPGSLPESPGPYNTRSLNDVDFDSLTSGWTVGSWYGTDSGARSLTVAKQWTGQRWVTRPTVNPGGMANVLNGVDSISADDAWAVGRYEVGQEDPFIPLIEHWDGAHWSQVAEPKTIGTYATYTAVDDVSPTDVWTVGYGGGQVGGPGKALIAHWDGTRWVNVPHPHPGTSGLYGVSAVSTNDVWAVGFGAGPLIEHWDGRAWKQVPSNAPARTLFRSVAAVSSDDVWAVGQVQDADGLGPVLVDHWDGTDWTVVNTPALQGDRAFLDDVDASSATDVWAVGGWGRSTDDVGRTLIEHWDGTAWSVVPSPNRERTNVRGRVNALYGVAAVDPTDAWSVGAYRRDDSSYKTKWMVASWNGDHWANVFLH